MSTAPNIPEINLAIPEDVRIRVINDSRASRGWRIVETSIIKAHPLLIGAATYEALHDGLLHYALKDIIPGQLTEGVYLIYGVNAYCINHENWLFDCDMSMTYSAIRRVKNME